MNKFIQTKHFTTRKIMIWLALLTIVASSLQQTIAYAIDVDFYSSNDILYYDPTSCTVKNQTGDIAIVGNDNAEKIFKFFISTNFSGMGDKPFTAVQAAGALGNFFQESSMDPGAIETNGEGHGLAQWSYDRKTTLFALAASENKQWSDFDLQLKMIQNEINGSYGPSLLTAGFADVKTPQEASLTFQVIYEGAGVPNQAVRDDAANSYYEKYKSLAPGDVSIGGDSTTSCAGGDVSGGLTNFSGSDFKIYNQCNYPPYGGNWGDMLFNNKSIQGCSGGCGPTALAMVISNMTSQKVTPLDTMNYYDDSNLWFGIGSNQTGLARGAEHWGLKATTFDTKDINAYKSIFEKGGLVVVAGNGAAPFMSGEGVAHYIVIRALTTEGKFLIGDPGQAESTNGTPGNPIEWDPTPILLNSIPSLSVSITK